MHCLDFERLVAIAQRHNIKTIVDTTFATPVNIRALAYGVDLVIHSVTKYLAGHNDVMAGAIIGSYDLLAPLRQAHAVLGCIVDPHAAYLILRGLKTLALRVQRHNINGLAVARFLEHHPKIRRVWYPGLESHRDHKIAASTMHGFGGVVSFEITGDIETTYRFIDALQIPTVGPSLGGVESLISPLAVMGYADIPPEERESLGIRDELIRFCIGIEDARRPDRRLDTGARHDLGECGQTRAVPTPTPCRGLGTMPSTLPASCVSFCVSSSPAFLVVFLAASSSTACSKVTSSG